MWLAAIGLSVPLLPALGTPVFWGLLPFEAAALGFLWFGFRRSDRNLGIVEEFTLWRDEVRVERREPSGRVLRWQTDPFWLRTRLHDKARIASYLTLAGGGREIELGAFLSPEERVKLKDEIDAAVQRALTGRPPDG